MSQIQRKKGNPFDFVKEDFPATFFDGSGVTGNGGNNSSDPVFDSGTDDNPSAPANGAGSHDLQYWLDKLAEQSGTSANMWSMHHLLTMLSKYGGADQSYISAMLSTLLAYTEGSGQSKEMEAYFMQLLMSQLQKSEQRGYDESRLREQRLYDSPSSALARLMGAGISRDAAMQMLSGSGDGSGSGSVIGSGESVGDASMTGTPGEMALQESLAPWQKAGVVINGVNALCSLVGAGVGVAQAIPQIRMLGAQAFLAQEQIKSFKAVNSITNAIQSGVAAGSLSKSVVDGWQNANDVVSFVNANPDHAFSQSVMQNGDLVTAFGSTFGRKQFNEDWQQRLQSRDAGTMFKDNVRLLRAQALRAEIDVSIASAELENINADTFLKTQDAQERMSRIVLNKSQTEYTDALRELTQDQIIEQELTNENLAMQFEINKSGFPMLKQRVMDELYDEMTYWCTITSDSVRQDRIDSWISQAGNEKTAQYLREIDLNSVGSFATEHPKLYKFMKLFKDLGGFDTLNAVTNGVDKVGSAYKSFKTAASFVSKIPK